MGTLFDSPRLTILRAQHHINDLNARVIEFINNQPWSAVVDFDNERRENLHKIKFARRLPADLSCIVFDAANNLRAALDQAGYASAVAGGTVDPKNAYFPFGNDLAGLDNVIRRGRCNDLPPEILTLFRRFKPYKGGDDTLWALNKLCNTKKHCALMPFALGRAQFAINQVTDHKVKFRDDGKVDLIYHGSSHIVSGAMSPQSPSWDPEKYEITLLRTPFGANLNLQPHVTLKVTLDGIDSHVGKPAVDVLNDMTRVVDTILAATEMECRRLGLIK